MLFFRVEAPLVNLGWKRITDKFDERFKLKWVECKTRINYGSFREGKIKGQEKFFRRFLETISTAAAVYKA